MLKTNLKKKSLEVLVFFKKYFFPALVLPALILGLILRFWGGLSSATFSYDQARDAFISQNIYRGDIKIAGPTSDIPGLFHGPLYYYLIGPVYLFSRGNPFFASAQMLLINLFALIPLGILVQKMFKDKIITLFVIFLYLISFESISYARWLSNPTLSFASLPLVYLGYWQVINKQNLGWIWLALGLGIAINGQTFLLYLLPLTLVVLFLFKIKPFPQKYLFCGIAILTLFLLYFPLSQIKFDFLGIKSALNYFSTDVNSSYNLENHLRNYAVKSSQLLQFNLFPQSKTAALIIFLALAVYFTFHFKRTNPRIIKFIFLLFFSNTFIFLITGFDSHFINLAASAPLLIVSGAALALILKKYAPIGTILILAIAAANTYATLENNPKGDLLFSVQKNTRLYDEVALVEKTYEISKGQKFSINAATNPLFTPTTWAYLYELHAKKNNLEAPHFHGNTASTFYGDHVFSRSGEITPVEFTIIEPDLPKFWVEKTIEDDNSRKPITETLQFGAYTLQVRR